MGQNPLTTLLQESFKFGFICSLVSTGNGYCISSALPDPPIRRYGIVLYLFFNCTHSCKTSLLPILRAASSPHQAKTDPAGLTG